MPFRPMSNPHVSARRQRRTSRISRQRRLALYAAFALLLGTGLVWLLVHFLGLDPESTAPWQAWSMKVHGAAAFYVTFLLGIMWSEHIRSCWIQGQNRLAGGLFGAVVGLLLVTGFGLYYFNGESLRSLTEWLHWSGGIVVGALFWVHRAVGLRRAAGRD